MRAFRGGRLTLFVDAWTKRGAPGPLIQLISGYKIPFQAKPPLVSPSLLSSRYQTAPSSQMDQVINSMAVENILEGAPDTPSFISTLFLTPKSDGSMRPIFNLKRLNQFVKITKFRLISVHRIPDFIQPNDWMVKVDLTQAYYHVPVSQSHRCFLRLFYRGQLLQMTCLPFGLATAPKTFASLSNWTAEILREQGIRIAVFLDDFLIVCQDRLKLVNQTKTVLLTMQELGWKVNIEKSILVPQKSLEYLGLVWDPWQNKKFLPEKKIHGLQGTISKLLKRKKATLREVQSIVGSLNFARLVVPQGRLNFRYLLTHCNSLLQKHAERPYSLPRQTIGELKWWMMNCQTSSRLHPPSKTHFLTTDAADSGWGAELNGMQIGGDWLDEEESFHSNHKEMLTILKCLSQFGRFLSRSSMLLQCDNKSVVAYLRNEGGSRSAILMNLTYQIFEILDRFDIHLVAHHIPGRYNSVADRLSRKSMIPEWHLAPSLTKVVFAKWGTPEIDLFASARAHVVQRYVSLDQRDPGAWRHNAFAWEWEFDLAWVFPPPNLMPRVLMHLNRAKGTFLIVAPKWPQAFWRADLKARAIAPPFTIHRLETVLIDLSTGHPPPKVHDLNLEVWKCGGGLGL